MPAHSSGAATSRPSAVGDAQDEPLGDDDLLAVAALRRRAVDVRVAVGEDGLALAEVLVAVGALRALAARVDHAADADPVADREAGRPPAPTSLTTPAISCPGVSGYVVSPHSPRTVWMSLWQMPANVMSMRTSSARRSRRVDGRRLEAAVGRRHGEGGGRRGHARDPTSAASPGPVRAGIRARRAAERRRHVAVGLGALGGARGGEDGAPDGRRLGEAHGRGIGGASTCEARSAPPRRPAPPGRGCCDRRTASAGCPSTARSGLRIRCTSCTVSSSWPTPRWLSISHGMGMTRPWLAVSALRVSTPRLGEQSSRTTS